MQYCGLELLAGCLATGSSSEPHTRECGLGKQFVRESERVYCLELQSAPSPSSNLASQRGIGRGGGGRKEVVDGSHSSDIPSLAQAFYLGLSRGAARGKSHSDFY